MAGFLQRYFPNMKMEKSENSIKLLVEVKPRLNVAHIMLTVPKHIRSVAVYNGNHTFYNADLFTKDLLSYCIKYRPSYTVPSPSTSSSRNTLITVVPAAFLPFSDGRDRQAV